METHKKNVAYFTVCNLAYLPRALVLAESLFKHGGLPLKVFLFDKRRDLGALAEYAELIWMEELNIPNFHRLAMRYDIIEFSTSLKPYLALQLLENHEKIIFFDPDICLYASPDSIVQDLDECSILLTPHYTTPQSRDPSESDLGMMKFGSFNLGFFAVKKDKQARSFLTWWSDRCLDFSFMEAQFGLSTDQKWVTIAPCLFQGIKVSFNPGYNMAPWNSFERVARQMQGGKYVVNDHHPLVFFHFSNFNGEDPQYLLKRALIERGVDRPDLLSLGSGYRRALADKSELVSICPYSYDYFLSGEYISPTLRRAYAAVEAELPPHDPFEHRGVVWRFAKRNGLLGSNEKPYRRTGVKDLHKNGVALRTIYIGMRVALRILGPNTFFNLSRLLVFLSSYRLNRGLWVYKSKR